MALKPLLTGCREYYGTDLIPADGVLQCNLEEPLSFDDNSFDVVTALDVLEHLDNPHDALHELCRVARKSVLISLPNMYYIEFRWRFLRGGGLSGKYQFPPHPVVDRHRWVLSYREALAFVSANTHSYGVEHEMVLPLRGRTKAISVPIERWLANAWPNLFAYGVLFEITLSKP
jgi:SAM-dependent methyltransferase